MVRRLALPAVIVLAACRAPAPEPRAARIEVVPSVAAPPPVVDAGTREETVADLVADDPEWVTPCVEGTPEHKAATARLASVSKSIADLPAGAPHEAVTNSLRRLVESPCFTIGPDLEMATIESALSLKTYWQAGGESALSSRLAWGNPVHRWLWLTPSFRKALTKEGAPKHPLAPLLCPADPGACGAETAGWTIRAEHAFDLHARAQHTQPKSYEECDKEAAATKPAEQAFTTWSQCMEQTSVRQDALPLGKFSAPKDGWLVLRGRRGHHAWCNELRAYDLATGSAYIASNCGGMFGRQPQPGIRVEKGRLPIDALREATWMMFLAEVSDHHVVVGGGGHSIPPGIAIRTPTNKSYSFGIGGFGTSSGRTTLLYQWVRAGKSVATGTVQWPDAYHAADEHATQLLTIAESGMKKGCAPAALPPIPWSTRKDPATRVTGEHGYFPDYDGSDFDDLERELAKAGAQPVPCP